MTVREAWKRAFSFLRAKGESAASDAERLVRHALGLDRTALLSRWDEPFPPECEPLLFRMLERRLAGEPVQYIVGEECFFGLTFEVTPATLIPRPETEGLVERAIREAERVFGRDARTSALTAADLGTGSGAIAVALAASCSGWRIVATDLSREALAVARRNAERNGVADRIAWLEGDWLRPLEERGIAPDLIVSNPPYVRSGDIAGLQDEVRLYEPHLALDGGPDGLACYAAILEQIGRLPRVPAIAAFETAWDAAERVAALVRQTGFWREIRIECDLAGLDRYVVGVA